MRLLLAVVVALSVLSLPVYAQTPIDVVNIRMSKTVEWGRGDTGTR